MPIGDPYISAEDLAEYLEMDPPAEDAGDSNLSRSVQSASRWVNHYVGGRDFNLATEATARYFDAYRDGTVWTDDIGSDDDLEIATDSSQDGTYPTDWDTSDYQLLPVGSLAAGEPVQQIGAVGSRAFPATGRRSGLVRVTALWGWPAVPADVQQATLIQAAHLFKRKDSTNGVIGGNDFGIVRVGRTTDPDVADLLAPYRLIRL